MVLYSFSISYWFICVIKKWALLLNWHSIWDYKLMVDILFIPLYILGADLYVTAKTFWYANPFTWSLFPSEETLVSILLPGHLLTGRKEQGRAGQRCPYLKSKWPWLRPWLLRELDGRKHTCLKSPVGVTWGSSYKDLDYCIAQKANYVLVSEINQRKSITVQYVVHVFILIFSTELSKKSGWENLKSLQALYFSAVCLLIKEGCGGDYMWTHILLIEYGKIKLKIGWKITGLPLYSIVLFLEKYPLMPLDIFLINLSPLII